MLFFFTKHTSSSIKEILAYRNLYEKVEYIVILIPIITKKNVILSNLF